MKPMLSGISPGGFRSAGTGSWDPSAEAPPPAAVGGAGVCDDPELPAPPEDDGVLEDEPQEARTPTEKSPTSASPQTANNFRVHIGRPCRDAA